MTHRQKDGVHIEVTEQDIQEGLSEIQSCPLALALRRQFNTNNVGVTPHYAYVLHTKFELSDEATSWIIDFDHGIGVPPKTFNL